jgi:hypothetical protein
MFVTRIGLYVRMNHPVQQTEYVRLQVCYRDIFFTSEWITLYSKQNMYAYKFLRPTDHPV